MPTTATTTAIATVAPVDSPELPPLPLLPVEEEEEEEGEIELVELPVVVAVAVADAPLPDPDVLPVVVAAASVASYTIRMPCAFSPPGLLTDSTTVLVVPSWLRVTLTVVAASGATHVQYRVAHTSDSVDGVTHPRPKSANIGQHVTVVMLATPALSWQAVEYPLGQASPGEK